MRTDSRPARDGRNKLHSLLSGVLLILISFSVTADELQPFTSDGCSLFPDGNLPGNDAWLHCCIAHDQAYWRGGTFQQRLDADYALRDCVVEAGHPEIAEMMLAGVRVGGGPISIAPYRWGYGWTMMRGYRPLSEEEKALADLLLPNEISTTGSSEGVQH